METGYAVSDEVVFKIGGCINNVKPDSDRKKKHPSVRGSSVSPVNWHLLWLPIGFGVAAFFASLVIAQGDGLFAVVCAGILVASIELAGIWAVFGTGGYLQRLCLSHAAGVFVFACFGFGLLIVSSINRFGPDADDMFIAATRGLLVIPPLSIAVQVPMWFFRAILGWQFTVGGCKPSLPFTLREIFTFTFVVALAVATPQLSARLSAADLASSGQPLPSAEVKVMNADGTVDQVPETQPQAEQRQREFIRDMERMYLSMILTTSVTFFVISVLAVPVLVFTFRPKEPAAGCLFSFLYGLAILIFNVGLFSLLGNGGALPVEIFGLMAVGIFTATAAGSIALVILRSGGFTLTSPKRFQKMETAAGPGQTSRGQ